MRRVHSEWQVPKAPPSAYCQVHEPSRPARSCGQESRRAGKATVAQPEPDCPPARARRAAAALRVERRAHRRGRGRAHGSLPGQDQPDRDRRAWHQRRRRPLPLRPLRRCSGADRDRLLVLTRESRRRSWWQQYGLPDSVADLHRPRGRRGLDPPVQDKRRARPTADRGLRPRLTPAAGRGSQTMRSSSSSKPGSTRQELLEPDRPPDLWAIIDEERCTGSSAARRSCASSSRR